MENNNRQGCRLKELIDWIDTFGFAKDHETTKQIIRLKAKYLLDESIEPCATSSEKLVYVPCDENDERAVGGFTSTDGRSLCYVRECHINSNICDRDCEELKEALRELVRCNPVFKDNLLSADVTLMEFSTALAKAKQLLNL